MDPPRLILLLMLRSVSWIPIASSRDLDCQYKAAFALAHKLREAMGAEMQDRTLSVDVEIDGGYFGGYRKPENHKRDRVDSSLAIHRTGKRNVVVVMRERGGKSLARVFKHEGHSLDTIHERVEEGSTVYADEAASWDGLHARYDTHRINHQISFSDEGACTNQAESYFSRLRRAEFGTYHHISGRYLQTYANEGACCEDHRRVSNGEKFQVVVSAALAHSVLRQWRGYWQRNH